MKATANRPRDDLLSGSDVIRKIVILARESGYCFNTSDVEARLFVPDHLFTGPLDSFFAALGDLDRDMEVKRRNAEAAGRRFRFVARMADGKLSVGLEEVDSSHPFYYLDGSNNVILITTERYHDYPMEIKGLRRRSRSDSRRCVCRHHLYCQHPLMLYYSTANPRHRVSLLEAVGRGLPPDGGVYMPERLPFIPKAFFNNMADMSLKDIGYVVANTLLAKTLPLPT